MLAYCVPGALLVNERDAVAQLTCESCPQDMCDDLDPELEVCWPDTPDEPTDPHTLAPKAKQANQLGAERGNLAVALGEDNIDIASSGVLRTTTPPRRHRRTVMSNSFSPRTLATPAISTPPRSSQTSSRKTSPARSRSPTVKGRRSPAM
jgi:hypothetical protein